MVALAALLAVVASVVVVVVALRARQSAADAHRRYLGSDGWPSAGQAAYWIGSGVQASPGQQPVPIASLAKVMTARLVLAAHPLRDGADGPSIVMTARDVTDTDRRRHLDQSVVSVAAGERLTERQALQALLLPSANNIAAVLARYVSGSPKAFVVRMNAEARRLHMIRTRYTDPSGFAPTTVSTAADQVRLAVAMSRQPEFTAIVSMPSARLPIAGTVRNTDTLLGHDGFVGTKTGSHDAAGGCFMFTSYRVLAGKLTPMTGVVLGQPGHDLITAGLTAARQLADRVAPVAQG
jgi:D-alanyl-D-alanine carboxypeptidase (penicillin-binding protein 5/6)